MKFDAITIVKFCLNVCFDLAFVLLAIRILAPELMDVDFEVTFPQIALFVASILVLTLIKAVASAALKDVAGVRSARRP